MSIQYKVHTGLPPQHLIPSLVDLLTSVFTDQSRDEWLADLTHKATTYPAFQSLLALDDNRVVGCKLGYEWQSDTYYSWVGAVDQAYRRRGIAGNLMERQHAACLAAGYTTVRTHTYNSWRDMLVLNIENGFDIVGTQPGKRGLMIMLEKSLT